MTPFLKKIPRGVIYHKLVQSLAYLLRAWVAPLDRQDRIEDFEKAFASYCESKYCIAFPFARTAIHFILKGLDLPKGSGIIMPPITIKGIVDVVVDLGLVPVYVDLDINTINFRLDELEKKIDPNVRVALITTLFGLVPDMTAMVQLLKKNGIFIIEDFSQCLNGRFDGKRVGTFGDVGVFSSSSIKTLDTLGGGLAITNDESIHRSLRKAQSGLSTADRKFLAQKAWTNLVRNFATSQPFFSFLTFPFLQLIRKRNPQLALKQTGQRDKQRLAQLPRLWFCRYTSVQASIGLEHIGAVAAEDKARKDNVDFIKSNNGIQGFPPTTPSSTNVYWQLILIVPDALKAQVFLAKRGIDTATSSLELVCELRDYPNRVELPNAKRIYQNGIFIPCFPCLGPKDLQRIASALKDHFRDDIHGR